MRYIPPRKAMPASEHSLKQQPIERHYYYEGDTSGGYYYEEGEAKYTGEKDASDRKGT